MRKLYYWDKATQSMVEHRPEVQKEVNIHIIDDTMPATWHPKDGKFYDSKSAFRSVTAAHGCREVGTDYEGKPDSFFQPEPPKRNTEETKRIMHGLMTGEIPVPHFPKIEDLN